MANVMKTLLDVPQKTTAFGKKNQHRWRKKLELNVNLVSLIAGVTSYSLPCNDHSGSIPGTFPTRKINVNCSRTALNQVLVVFLYMLVCFVFGSALLVKPYRSISFQQFQCGILIGVS
jgi:uncharacterized membrane protein YhaH (DUF805 family)